MNGPTLNDFITAEPIYIVAPSESIIGPITAFEDIVELKDYLIDIDFYTEEVVVYYGTCSPATAIPEDISNVTTYLIIMKDDDVEGYTIETECESGEDLTSQITDIINKKSEYDKDTTIKMEHLFVLYGEELPLRLTIAESDMAAKVMEKCKELKYAAEELANFV